MAYALAGADCIDVAADAAIVRAAREGLGWAAEKATERGEVVHTPWLMVSINDGEDPHFRKASFEADRCLTDCHQPCIDICPAEAIAFPRSDRGPSGVIDSRCYGCGRCLPVCPIGHIHTQSYVLSPEAIAAQLFSQIDAVEIHTQIGRLHDFERLWGAIRPWVRTLRAVSVSCPDGNGSVRYLWQLHELIRSAEIPIIWQTDGRPMSGDIGGGTTHAAIRYAQKVIATGPPGFVQLAGGTNLQTVPRLRSLGLLRSTSSSLNRHIAGIAYGSYARGKLMAVLNQLASDLDADFGRFDKPSNFAPCSSSGEGDRLIPDRSIDDAVSLAKELVSQLKPAPETTAVKPTY
ncbi:4Fe-4S ferredoxin [filamentous cyanobacterium CCP5]|nr:4Fe-4S ferredoxin [filamentous cyanobacterium CCP5]